MTSFEYILGTYAPRSLFDRHPAFQKQKLKAQQKRLPLGSGSYVHGPLPATFQPQNAVSGLRHPIPRQQVEAENQPEWLIQEDWALLHTIKDVQVYAILHPNNYFKITITEDAAALKANFFQKGCVYIEGSPFYKVNIHFFCIFLDYFSKKFC